MRACKEIILVRGKVDIAFSGGNTPKILFAVLAVKYKDKIQWEKLHFYWVDERCVSPENEDSNYGNAEEILFNKIYPADSKNIHRIHGENEPEEEAKRYAGVLKTNVTSKNSLPRFDIIFLGMGDDGHTASIFPDRMDLLTAEELCAVAEKPDTKQKRITLTGKVISNAERIYFLVTGIGKSKIVQQILEKNGDYSRYPAAGINSQDGEVKWYLDAEAAEQLTVNS